MNNPRWDSQLAASAIALVGELPEALPPPRRRAALRAFLRNPSAVIGLAVLTFFSLVAAIGPIVYTQSPLYIAGPQFLWPGQNPGFPLGTDALGRDVLAGLIHGARISLTVGIAATLLGVVIGASVGAIAGYFGRWLDNLLVRIIEVFQTLPDFVLVVVLVAILTPSMPTVVLAIAIIRWPTVARLTRAEFRSLREAEFVLAARSLGYSPLRIILREILPNALPVLIVTTSVLVASAMLMESALAFMGLGDPNLVSWGSMIGSARESLRTAWYLTAIPGFAILLSVLGVNFLGDGLNDALNPRLSADGGRP